MNIICHLLTEFFPKILVLIFRKSLAPAVPLEEQQTTADKTPTPSGELWRKSTLFSSSRQQTPIIAFYYTYYSVQMLWCSLLRLGGGTEPARNTLCIPAEGANTIAWGVTSRLTATDHSTSLEVAVRRGGWVISKGYCKLILSLRG